MSTKGCRIHTCKIESPNVKGRIKLGGMASYREIFFAVGTVTAEALAMGKRVVRARKNGRSLKEW